GCVAEVAAERQALGELLVEAQGAGDGASDLRPLQAVGQAGPVVVAFVVDEDLGLVLEPAERRAVDHAVAVALEARAERMLLLGVTPAAGEAAPPRGGGQPAPLPRFPPRPRHERQCPPPPLPGPA